MRSLQLLLFFSVILSVSCRALGSDNDSQIWSILRYNHNWNSLEFSAQLQLRYTLGDGKLYEEQFNPAVQYSTDHGNVGFIFTLGTINGFESRREYRYALEYEFVIFENDSFIYETRFRQELRNFTGVNEHAHRFRVLNELSFKKYDFKGYKPFISSEFNFYLNDFDSSDNEGTGVSSHRTIVGVTRAFKDHDLTFSYVHDYGVRMGLDEIRHVLLGTAAF